MGQKNTIRFITVFLILFGFWYFIYEFFINPWNVFDLWVIDCLVKPIDFSLNTLGYDTIVNERHIALKGTGGVWIGDSCNAVDLFALFICFLIAYPVGKWLYKLLYGILGVISIYVLNLLRIIALLFIQKHFPQSLDFNHTYTFTILMYCFIFMLWMLWINNFSKK